MALLIGLWMDKSSAPFYLLNIGLVLCALAVTYVAALFILGAGSLILQGNTERSGSLSWGTTNDTGEAFQPVCQENDGNLSGAFTFRSSDDLLLLALVDYNVTPFYYNGSYGRSHFISAAPGATGGFYSTGQFCVPGLQGGLHDVYIAVVMNPYESSGEAGGSRKIIGESREVIVGNGTWPAPVFRNRSSSRYATYLKDETGTSGLLTEAPLSGPLPAVINSQPVGLEEYYVNVPQRPVNNTILNTSFAIVQLLDYEQIPVRQDAPDLVYYGWMNDSDSCSVRLSLKAPDSPGPHQITVLLLSDPYDSMELTPDAVNYGAGKGLVGDSFVLNVKQA